MTDRQKAYEDRYFERMERDCPKPDKSLSQLKELARKAIAEEILIEEWQIAITPQLFLDALAQEEWHRRNPLYMCIECKDGKLLPQGYVCNICGEENPGNQIW